LALQTLPLSCQWAVASQVKGCWPAHSPVPGTHCWHEPLTHAGVVPVHGAPIAIQAVPVALHCAGCAPLHPSSLATHVLHKPSMHTGALAEHAGPMACH
jgi:hypothetical protein